MKICVVQTRPVKGIVESNISQHKKLVMLALSCGATAIFFPELSLTGYEPGLAQALATDKNDERLNDFQVISNVQEVTIGVGMPVKSDNGSRIGMIIFQPGLPRHLYTKQHLHEDEYPYFAKGEAQTVCINDTDKIAIAICYELTVPQHAEDAHKSGALFYVASVAKTAAGVQKATVHLAATAQKYSMTVMMSNCIGVCDNEVCGGQTAIWNKEGALIEELDNIHEGILVFDTVSGAVTKKYLE